MSNTGLLNSSIENEAFLTTEEKRIIDGLKSRDEKVISQFIDLYGPYIYSIVFNVVKNKFDAEEATQDVVLKIISKIETFDYTCKLKTWMYTIANRRAIDYRRRVKYYDDVGEAHQLKMEESTIKQIEDQEKKSWIQMALNELPEKDSQLLQLYYLKELSIQEVGEITGLSVSNIKVKLFRLRHKMAQKLKKYSDYEV